MSTRGRKVLAMATLLTAVLALGALVETARRDGDHLTASIAGLRAYRGRPLPDMNVRTDDGRTLSLAALGEGFDRLIVVFVRSGCPRCQSVLATLNQHAPAADPMAAVVIVEVGAAGSASPGVRSVAPSWTGAIDTDGAFEHVLGGRVVPVLMVVDGDRTVREVFVGANEAQGGLTWVEPAWARARFGR